MTFQGIVCAPIQPEPGLSSQSQVTAVTPCSPLPCPGFSSWAGGFSTGTRVSPAQPRETRVSPAQPRQAEQEVGSGF